MTKHVGYEIKCLCCKQLTEYDLVEMNVFGDELVLTCWWCNDYHIRVGREGVRHTFRYDSQTEENKDTTPIYRFMMVEA